MKKLSFILALLIVFVGYSQQKNLLESYRLDKSNNYELSPIYTIQLKVHVLHFSETDPRNYTKADVPDILQVFSYVNRFYSELQQPSIAVNDPSYEDTDSRIRFRLTEKDIDFIVDPIGWDRYVDSASIQMPIAMVKGNKRLYVDGKLPFARGNCIEIVGSKRNNGIYTLDVSNYNEETGKSLYKLRNSSLLPDSTDQTGYIIVHKDRNLNTDNYNYITHHKEDKHAIHIYLTSSTSVCYQIAAGAGPSPYWLNYTHPHAAEGMLVGDNAWVTAQLLAHELGHCLELLHTDSPQFQDLPKRDQFGFIACNNTTVSNNIMGYNTCRNYLSPLQIAHIRKQLTSNPDKMRRVVEAHGGVGNKVSVKNRTVVWEKNEIISDELVVDKNAVLVIKGTVHFSKGALLTIKPGGKVILDGGTLTNQFDQKWKGVVIKTKEKDHNLVPDPKKTGILEIINGGKILQTITD